MSFPARRAREWGVSDHGYGVDKGKKFNARKETAQNEEYYGIKIFRFYIVRPSSVCPMIRNRS